MICFSCQYVRYAIDIKYCYSESKSEKIKAKSSIAMKGIEMKERQVDRYCMNNANSSLQLWGQGRESCQVQNIFPA